MNRKFFRNIIRETLKEENDKSTLTLYHGTTEQNAKALLNNGWEPLGHDSRGNLGNPNYLYLSTHPEDAKWFVEDQDDGVVLKVSDIPIDYLIPDPEDEAGFTMEELLNRMKKVPQLPVKFALKKSISSDYFELYNTDIPPRINSWGSL